jgi:glutamate synthase domain-containing protein 3
MEDARFRPVADRYWNARGGSHTDGGAFVFTVNRDNGRSAVSCADKFGRLITCPPGDWAVDPSSQPDAAHGDVQLAAEIARVLESRPDAVHPQHHEAFARVSSLIPSWDLNRLHGFVRQVGDIGRCDGEGFEWAIELLALLNDRRYDCGRMKRSAVLHIVRGEIDAVLDVIPPIVNGGAGRARRIDWNAREDLRAPMEGETTLVIAAPGFAAEGEDCDARLAVRAYELGWRRFIVYGLRGQRFTGCGFGPETDGVRMDVFGSSGDYLASGIDGMEIHVHGNGQDQIGQIMKRGTLVVHGDVGQTFMYGAKGGEVYVMGNAAGRPLINAVGRPRVVINGVCLDYLAESFMAGDPHNGGGFVIMNGIEFDDRGRVRDQASPYPGSNLFSLASGGAIFIRDPHRRLVAEQLNGGEFAEPDEADWQLILPYLQANERYFGISIERDLLTVDGVCRAPAEVYRKVRAVRLAVLRGSEE